VLNFRTQSVSASLTINDFTMLSLFKKKLTPKWTFQKEGYIWRAFFLGSNYLIGEHRAKGKREVSFFLLDTKTGKPLWDNFILRDDSNNPIGEGWWVGIETVYKNLFFLHGYYSPTVPEHHGIWAIDAQTRTITWAKPDLAFLALIEGELLVYHDVTVQGYTERSFQILDAFTGELTRDLDQDLDAAEAFRQNAQDFATEQGVKLPMRHNEHSPEFTALDSFARKITSAKRVLGGYDSLTLLDGNRVLGYHEQTEKIVLNQGGAPVQALDYKLFLLEGEKIIFSENIGSSMSGFLVDGFFTRSSMLYFVKNDSLLTAIDLS
jgi:hypothetical protein